MKYKQCISCFVSASTNSLFLHSTLRGRVSPMMSASIDQKSMSPDVSVWTEQYNLIHFLLWQFKEDTDIYCS